MCLSYRFGKRGPNDRRDLAVIAPSWSLTRAAAQGLQVVHCSLKSCLYLGDVTDLSVWCDGFQQCLEERLLFPVYPQGATGALTGPQSSTHIGCFIVYSLFTIPHNTTCLYFSFFKLNLLV